MIATRIPASINAKLSGLCAPKRAWALAKAFAEAQRERSFKEQSEVTAKVTADDPQPPDWKAEGGDSIEAMDAWKAWYERNEARIEIAVKPIIAKYNVSHWEKVAKYAEKNMVEWALETMTRIYTPEQLARIQPMFDAYASNAIYGELSDRFLKLLFNCPES